MNLFTNNKFVIGLILAVILLAFIIFLWYISKSSSSDTSTKNIVKTFTDDSDCPQPPSTLEYNRSLAPPKRNNNIVNACAAGLPEKRYDKVNGFYFTIPGDLPL